MYRLWIVWSGVVGNYVESCSKSTFTSVFYKFFTSYLQNLYTAINVLFIPVTPTLLPIFHNPNNNNVFILSNYNNWECV